MSETNSDSNKAGDTTQAPEVNNSASMVTPKNQVVLEPQELTVNSTVDSSAPSLTPEAPVQQNSQQGAQPVASQEAEVAWPDAHVDSAEPAVPAPNYSVKPKSSGSKVGLIIGLIVVLGLAIGVYLALQIL